MAEGSRTFHESWYRIANQRICLKPSVRVQRQLFRGRRWYVLYDPFNNQFFRLHPSSYEFIARLNKKRTVEDVWKEIMTRDPDNAPGQEDVIRLLAQLYHANLLYFEASADSTKLFERYKQRKQKIMQATLMNIMFFRIPLFDPDNFLKRALPFVRWLMSPLGAVLWCIVVFAGLKVAVDNFAVLKLKSQGILAPSNLFLLYAGIVIIKTLHEFGHAFAVRRFKGEVHAMGVMFLIFTPLPYVDATAAWAFRSKWKRVFVGAAGMIVEVFFAACAVLVWANTGEGLLHSLAYNMLFIASVSTLLFNLNPLLRYDGYYILSDMLDIPNLHTQSSQQLLYLVEHYAFGCKQVSSPAVTVKEGVWLAVFGVLSGVYRIVVFSAILLFVADRFLLAGIIMAVICAVAWVAVPFVQMVRYLAVNPRLERTRARAVAVTAVTLSLVLGFLVFFPFPHNSKASGILKAFEYEVVASKVDGYIDSIIVASEQRVKKGEILIRLRNKELDFNIAQSRAKLREVMAARQKAMEENQADLKPLDSRIAAVRKQLEHLLEDKENLMVKAGISGVWVAPSDDYIGMWVLRGTPVGQIVNDSSFYFSSVVSEQEASRIFADEIRSAQVRLSGDSGINIPVRRYIKIPMEQVILPSSALGWGGGGEIAIDTTDASGRKAAEPFYELRAEISPDTKVKLLHGRSGRIKLNLAGKPLMFQWWRRLRQLIQKRYQI